MPSRMSNKMKCTNQKITWNTQDTNLSWYVPKANVDHTISGQGTVISTLDHSATIPRAKIILTFDDIEKLKQITSTLHQYLAGLLNVWYL